MKSICVFLSAKTGHGERVSLLASELGQEIALSGLRLVYGGSSHGLMGILAQSVIDNGGRVTGIIPKVLIDQENPLESIEQLIITETMQERKLLMQQHSDGFIVMPGGLGTLEEAFEIWNSIKIGVINKPIGFLNLDGYYDGLFSFMEHCEFSGLVSSSHRKIPIISADPKKLLDALFEVKISTI